MLNLLQPLSSSAAAEVRESGAANHQSNPVAPPAEPPHQMPPEPAAPPLHLIGLEEAAHRLVLLQTISEHVQERAAQLRQVHGWRVGADVLRDSAHNALEQIEMRDLQALNDLLGLLS